MAVNQYDVHDLVRVSAVFRSLAGVATDPTTVVVKYVAPGGSPVTKTYGSDLEVVKDSTGCYHLDIDVTAEGTWTYRFNGSGALQAAGEQTFFAKDTVF